MRVGRRPSDIFVSRAFESHLRLLNQSHPWPTCKWIEIARVTSVQVRMALEFVERMPSVCWRGQWFGLPMVSVSVSGGWTFTDQVGKFQAPVVTAIVTKGEQANSNRSMAKEAEKTTGPVERQRQFSFSVCIFSPQDTRSRDSWNNQHNLHTFLQKGYLILSCERRRLRLLHGDASKETIHLFVLSSSHNPRFLAWFPASLSTKKQSDPIFLTPLIFQHINERFPYRWYASSHPERLE